MLIDRLSLKLNCFFHVKLKINVFKMELMSVETADLALRWMRKLLYAIVLADLMVLIVNKVSYFRAHYIFSDCDN